MNAQDFFSLLKATFTAWNEDKVPRLGAALAYYTIFALVPLSIITIRIGGLAFGQAQAQAELVALIHNWIGAEAAQFVRSTIEASHDDSTSLVATVIGFATLLFGALGWFVQLQDALNTIWEVTPKANRGLLKLVKERFFSLLLVLGSGLLLLLSMLVSTLLGVLYKFFGALLPLRVSVIEGLNFTLSLAAATLIFAFIFKVLPDAEIRWRDVWLGALLTAILFSLGKYLISFYLSNSSVGSVYGTAGSLAVLLVWIYYSAQILFFGAEFTQVYTRRTNPRLRPSAHAQAVGADERAQQGLARTQRVEHTTRR